MSLVTLPLGWCHPVQQAVKSEMALLPSCFMRVAEFLLRIRCFCCFFIFVAILYSMYSIYSGVNTSSVVFKSKFMFQNIYLPRNWT